MKTPGGNGRASARGRATRLRERAVLRAYLGATWALGHAPVGASKGVGGLLAQGTYLAWPARRRASRASLARVLGTAPTDPRVDRLARRMYRNYAGYIVDLMRMPSLERSEILLGVDVTAAGDMQRVFDMGQGVIIVAAHIAYNEYGAVAVADRGWPVTVIADDTEYKDLFEHLRLQRERWGVRLVPWKNLRDLYGALRRKESVALLVDWGYKADGVPVRFLDEWTTLPAGPAVLAARTGAVIAPFAMHRRKDGYHAGWIGSPIQVASTEPVEVARATQALADALGSAIRRTPDQWWVFKSMWPETAEERAALRARLPEYGLDPGAG
jgi:KDO2-lipid IV(A) lauroyltransferase